MLKKLDEYIRIAIGHKATAAVLALIFAVTLIPVLSLAGINTPTGDDIGYGVLTRAAWTETHSLVEVIKAAVNTVKGFYYGWQGTWFTLFLFTLQPAVFMPEAYVIVPWLILSLWGATTLLIVHYLMKRVLGFSGSAGILAGILLMMAGVYYVPSTKSAIFWYNGTAHYMIPYALVFLSFYFCLRFCLEGSKPAFWGMLIGMTLLGGANYQAALLIFLLCGLMALLQFGAGKKRRGLLCLIPLGTELAGLIASMLSPGNKARGGEAFGFSVGKAVSVVLQCFVQAAADGLGYIKEHPLLFLFFIGLFLVAYYGRSGRERHYPLPLLAIILSYCIYSAMYAPQIYAAVEVSGGVGNMNYLVFLLMAAFNVIYLTGWWKEKTDKGQNNQQNSLEQEKLSNDRVNLQYGLPVLLIIASVFLLVVFRSDLKSTTPWQCIEYTESGEAANFAAQMEIYDRVLNDKSIMDAILPEVNDRQGPLMHMPLTDDPEAWTNRITADYYGKKSIIAVSREEWEEIQ